MAKVIHIEAKTFFQMKETVLMLRRQSEELLEVLEQLERDSSDAPASKSKIEDMRLAEVKLMIIQGRLKRNKKAPALTEAIS